MTLHFTCTFEDYVEALRVHRSLARGQRPGAGERLLFLWIVLVILGLFVGLAMAEGIYRGATGAARVTGAVTVSDWFIAILVPVLLWTICFGLIWFAFSAAIGPTERRPFRNALLLMLVALLVVNLIDVALHGVQSREARRAAAAAAPAEEHSLFSTLSPWLVLGAAVWFVLFRYLRGAARRNWDAQPHLHLPQTLELTNRGLRIGGERSTHDYAWSAFPKYREGANVFLLYISDLAFHMVPKRAMSDPAQVDAFRAVVAQHVPCVDPGPTGFTVQPPMPAAPRPVMPVSG